LIHPDLVAETKRLLALGTLSQQAIARRVGISRGSVGNILHGRRREDHEQYYPALDETPCPPTRCGGCGGQIVVLPCRLCRARAALAAAERQPGAIDPPDDSSLDLNLSPEEQARHAKMQQFKRAQGETRSGPWEEPVYEDEAREDDEDFDLDGRDRAA